MHSCPSVRAPKTILNINFISYENENSYLWRTCKTFLIKNGERETKKKGKMKNVQPFCNECLTTRILAIRRTSELSIYTSFAHSTMFNLVWINFTWKGFGIFHCGYSFAFTAIGFSSNYVIPQSLCLTMCGIHTFQSHNEEPDAYSGGQLIVINKTWYAPLSTLRHSCACAFPLVWAACALNASHVTTNYQLFIFLLFFGTMFYCICAFVCVWQIEID